MSDNEFDRLFKEKSQNFDYEFEEEAWVLMEKKLRKKDRIIFLRNLSIAACTLLFLAGGIFLYDGNQDSITARKTKPVDSVSIAVKPNISVKDNRATNPANTNRSRSKVSQRQGEDPSAIAVHSKTPTDLKVQKQSSHGGDSFNSVDPADSRSINNTYSTTGGDTLHHLDLLVMTAEGVVSNSELSIPERQVKTTRPLDSSQPPKSKLLKPSLGFTFSAGPDFSSTRSLAGKRGDLNVGLLINVNWKNLTFSTGARYGVKKYDAEALDYALRNPARASEIYNIDASCNVLEIPLQLSVPVWSLKNRSISLTGGLSSYLMLKEKYLFEYTPESGVNDFLLKKTNANQSYFGVASISGRYTFKSTNQNIRFGLEPYVKLPLGGVGEGKVKLKSSGISLTMTYGTTKKH
ncbi:hypothetical protein [Desertivirga arenae]|uniref:hypothetical protein n=1 Tax=Desertivirga arenae TaxID=2810309 RepID=UPI001A95DA47|nr:hypothetical protein [Pedobacter sp. SYSU D00823]